MSSLLSKIRNVGSKVGGVVKKAAPLAGLVPGVGPLLGMGIGALGSIAQGHNGIKGTAIAAAEGGASGLANKTLLNEGGLPALIARMRGTPSVPGAPGDAGSAGSSGGIIDKIAGAAGSLIPHNKDGSINLGSILGMGAAGYGAVTGNKLASDLRKKQDTLVGKQTGIADEIAGQGRDLNANAAQLRNAATPALMARLAAGPRQTPSFAARFTNASNPFAAKYAAPLAMPGSMPGSVPPPMPPAAPPPPPPGLQPPPPPLALPPGLVPKKLPMPAVM